MCFPLGPLLQTLLSAMSSIKRPVVDKEKPVANPIAAKYFTNYKRELCAGNPLALQSFSMGYGSILLREAHK